MSLRISLSRFVRTTLFTVIIVNVLLDCWLIHLPGDLLSRADGQTISCCTATKRESRGTWTGREKCILGAPTIVLPSRGSRIWLQETTRSVEPRVYDERVELSQGTNSCSGQYYGMEWNETEWNGIARVCYKISAFTISPLRYRDVQSNVHVVVDDDVAGRCYRPHYPWPARYRRQDYTRTLIDTSITLSFTYAKCQLYVLRMQIAYIYKRDHLLQI